MAKHDSEESAATAEAALALSEGAEAIKFARHAVDRWAPSPVRRRRVLKELNAAAVRISAAEKALQS
jgi:hypothetical protein